VNGDKAEHFDFRTEQLHKSTPITNHWSNNMTTKTTAKKASPIKKLSRKVTASAASKSRMADILEAKKTVKTSPVDLAIVDTGRVYFHFDGSPDTSKLDLKNGALIRENTKGGSYYRFVGVASATVVQEAFKYADKKLNLTVAPHTEERYAEVLEQVAAHVIATAKKCGMTNARMVDSTTLLGIYKGTEVVLKSNNELDWNTCYLFVDSMNFCHSVRSFDTKYIAAKSGKSTLSFGGCQVTKRDLDTVLLSETSTVKKMYDGIEATDAMAEVHAVHEQITGIPVQLVVGLQNNLGAFVYAEQCCGVNHACIGHSTLLRSSNNMSGDLFEHFGVPLLGMRGHGEVQLFVCVLECLLHNGCTRDTDESVVTTALGVLSNQSTVLEIELAGVRTSVEVEVHTTSINDSEVNRRSLHRLLGFQDVSHA
jgi:hypothetical protein